MKFEGDWPFYTKAHHFVAVKMPITISNIEYSDMIISNGFCNGEAAAGYKLKYSDQTEDYLIVGYSREYINILREGVFTEILP